MRRCRGYKITLHARGFESDLAVDGILSEFARAIELSKCCRLRGTENFWPADIEWRLRRLRRCKDQKFCEFRVVRCVFFSPPFLLSKCCRFRGTGEFFTAVRLCGGCGGAKVMNSPSCQQVQPVISCVLLAGGIMSAWKFSVSEIPMKLLSLRRWRLLRFVG